MNSHANSIKKGTFLMVCSGENYSAEIVEGPELLDKNMEAMFVGERHSKRDLVDLVRWLVLQNSRIDYYLAIWKAARVSPAILLLCVLIGCASPSHLDTPSPKPEPTGVSDAGQKVARTAIDSWEDFFVKEMAKKENYAVGLAYDGKGMSANTRQSQLRFFERKAHKLYWAITDDEKATAFQKTIELWIADLPIAP